MLSAETDPDKQLEALRVGGDSFIAKPIQREQLIGAIEHRIRMSRLLKDRRVNADEAEVFPGLLSKEDFLRSLDRFQDISNALGSDGTERLLRQLEQKLLDQLAAQECAARLDDFSFAVLARRVTREALEGFAEQLLRTFGATKLRAEDKCLVLTVTIGIVGELYEVHLRLRTLDGEHVPAGDFLPVAERSGLMPRIDRRVLEPALDVMDAERKSHPKLRLLIHQNVASVADEQWLPWFRDQMVRRNLIRRRPLLQFQMHEVRDHLDAAKPLVEVLRKYGIQVCVANVTGNAADLDLLADLPVALAKLSTSEPRPARRAGIGRGTDPCTPRDRWLARIGDPMQ
ncbi:EAL domain-containing protein [Thiocapsa sp.]|uniref:EAL domain-containing protein n=1 Tax=Thiocapsa sp. TaxID=2024551 RepID=UPI002B5864A4|nr:EAL domain-containing protein [Thiocapsa sp.]HSO84792.1 EAL domain-containing protein [Thiocapsa sp.]